MTQTIHQQDTRFFIVRSNTRDNIMDGYNAKRWASSNVDSTWDDVRVGDHIAVYLTCGGESDMDNKTKACKRGIYMVGIVEYKHSDKYAVDTKTWGDPFIGLLAIKWLNAPGHTPIVTQDEMRNYTSNGLMSAYGLVNICYKDLKTSDKLATPTSGAELSELTIARALDRGYFGEL